MIQIFTVTTPIPDDAADAAVSTLTAAMDRLTHLHPALRGAAVQASEGVLTMTLRVAGRDRWQVSGNCRKIASSMLRRVSVDPAAAVMELAQELPNGRKLTKDEGRNVSNHRPRSRGPRSWDEVPWGLGSQPTP